MLRDTAVALYLHSQGLTTQAAVNSSSLQVQSTDCKSIKVDAIIFSKN